MTSQTDKAQVAVLAQRACAIGKPILDLEFAFKGRASTSSTTI
jgi:hypothetical protein